MDFVDLVEGMGWSVTDLTIEQRVAAQIVVLGFETTYVQILGRHRDNYHSVIEYPIWTSSLPSKSQAPVYQMVELEVRKTLEDSLRKAQVDWARRQMEKSYGSVQMSSRSDQTLQEELEHQEALLEAFLKNSAPVVDQHLRRNYVEYKTYENLIALPNFEKVDELLEEVQQAWLLPRNFPYRVRYGDLLYPNPLSEGIAFASSPDISSERVAHISSDEAYLCKRTELLTDYHLRDPSPDLCEPLTKNHLWRIQ